MTDMDSRTEDRQASTGPSSESLKAQPATDLGVQSEGRKLIWSSPSYVSDDKEELQTQGTRSPSDQFLATT